jgi:hypothetical protein
MDFAALVSIASGIVPGKTEREHGRHTITLLLKEVARQMNATGCIL